MPQAVFDYHYGLEAEQYAFFRIPKSLMMEPHFKDISTDAKLLYVAVTRALHELHLLCRGELCELLAE